jgi:hypothetical protein
MPARLPRASMGHAVLLTSPGKGNRPLWSYRYTGTLPRLISFVCHSCENCRVCTQNSHSGNCHPLQVYLFSFDILANSFALPQNSTLLFSDDSELFRKNTRGWGYPSTQLFPGRPLSNGHYATGCRVRSLEDGAVPCLRRMTSSTGAAMISRTRSRSAGTSSFVKPLVSMVSCR